MRVKHEPSAADLAPTPLAEHDSASDVEAAGQEPASISPLVAQAAFPTDVAARRAARRNAARDRIKQRRGRKKHKMKAYELALALGMLAVGAIGAAYLGWYLLKPH